MVLDLMSIQCFIVIWWIQWKYCSLGVGNNSSVHAGNRKSEILILGKSPRDGLNDTAITECSININKEKKKMCLSLQYL